MLLRVAALKGIALGESSVLPWMARGVAFGAYGIGFVLYAIALLVVLLFTALHEQLLRPMHAAGALVILIGVWMVTLYA